MEPSLLADHKHRTSLVLRQSVVSSTHEDPDTENVEAEKLDGELSVKDKKHRHKYIIDLAQSFLTYGAPTHSLEAQLKKTAKALSTKATFLLLPNIVFISFQAEDGVHVTGLHIITQIGSLSLSQLRETHSVYRRVVRHEWDAQRGWQALRTIGNVPPPFSGLQQSLIAFLAGFTITLLAFDGSTADACCAGLFAALLSGLALFAATSNPLIAKVFELLAAFAISAIARGLYSHTNHRLCYSAISSGGIVLILPGFAVMSAALELSHKTMLTGSLKLVWAIFQALFIGFVQTLGSDTWLRFDSSARNSRLAMIQAITHPVYTQGYLAANWTISPNSPELLAFSIAQSLDATKAYSQFAYIGTGCYRSDDWPWYLQAPKWYASIPCIPVFALLLAFVNMQDWRTRKDRFGLVMMVILGCASYAANAAGEALVGGSVGNVTGAFAVSLLGSIYEQKFHGYAFVLMVPGVLLLVPTGLTAVGGLAQNYGGTDDQFASGLTTGFAMVTVSIGITIGLCLASFVIFFPMAVWGTFTGRKARVVFAF